MTPENSARPQFVIDATTESFQADVVDASVETPVLVDFWATWCGPCKSLGPVLEKLAADYNGAFVLAKVDVDKEQQLAAYFQIKSVPTVMLLKDGQIADGFPGALPEGELRKFLKQHGIEPNPPQLAGFEDAAADADESAEGPAIDLHAELEKAREAVAAKPEDDALKLGLALALSRTGDYKEAATLVDALPANLATDDRAEQVRARVALVATIDGAPDLDTLRAQPGDGMEPAALQQLAVRELLEGDAATGLEHLITLLGKHRSHGDGIAQKSLIQAFRILDDAQLVSRYRRRMASLLLV